MHNRGATLGRRESSWNDSFDSPRPWVNVDCFFFYLLEGGRYEIDYVLDAYDTPAEYAGFFMEDTCKPWEGRAINSHSRQVEEDQSTVREETRKWEI